MKKYIISISLISMCLLTFGQSFTLDDCKRLALENNRKLKNANLEKKSAELTKKEAYTNYFPSVSAMAVATKFNNDLLEISTPEMNLPVYDGDLSTLANATQFAYIPGMNIGLLDYLNAYSITVLQPVYAGGQIKTGNKLAALAEEISQQNIDLTQGQILVRTEQYYWTVISLQKNMETLLRYEKMLNQLLNDVTVSYESGLVSKSDMLKVQLEINKIKSNKLTLDNATTLLKMTLAQHIGKTYSEDFAVASNDIDIAGPEEFYQTPDKAVQNRPEYQMLNKVVTAEELQRKMAVGERMPTFAVGLAGFGFDMEDEVTNRGMVFASLSVPISDWWSGSYKVKNHDINIDMAQNNLTENTELLQLQIRQNYNTLAESYMQISVAQSNEEQAAEHLKITQDNYDAGIISTSDLLEAQAIHQAALTNLTDAKATYRIKQAQYLESIAELVN